MVSYYLHNYFNPKSLIRCLPWACFFLWPSLFAGPEYPVPAGPPVQTGSWSAWWPLSRHQDWCFGGINYQLFCMNSTMTQS